MRYLIVLCALLTLSGCGGGGSSSGGVPVVNFPGFNPNRVGTWKGRQTDTVTHQSGDMTLTIDAAGPVNGSWQTDAGVLWTISGRVDEAGTYPVSNASILNFSVPGLATPYAARGNLLVQITNHLGGKLSVYTHVPVIIGTTPVIMQFDIDMIRQ